MAYVYRVKRPNGKKSKKWYARYWDPALKKWRTKAGLVEKAATESLARRLEINAARRSEGLPVQEQHADGDLVKHVADWHTHILARGSGKDHADDHRLKVQLVIDACRWRSLQELSADAAESFLAECRAKDCGPTQGEGRGKRARGFGAGTMNRYITALKAFGRWLSIRRRTIGNSFDSLAHVPVDADIRHARRTLSVEQMADLVDAAAKGPRWRRSLTGPQRSILYVVATYTGLRSGELDSLTPESFDLAATPPTVSVQAAYSKRRRRDVLPLHADLIRRLRATVAKLEAGRPVFPGNWQADAADMLKVDLKAAGIPYRDAEGRVFDFHALRRQFITGLARAGVGLAQAQKLARHSTPILTANLYTDVDLAEQARDVAKLPPPPGSQK